MLPCVSQICSPTSRNAGRPPKTKLVSHHAPLAGARVQWNSNPIDRAPGRSTSAMKSFQTGDATCTFVKLGSRKMDYMRARLGNMSKWVTSSTGQ
ncbi:hypothetical protein Tco_0844676, partial [Tanacetum coccineum]